MLDSASSHQAAERNTNAGGEGGGEGLSHLSQEVPAYSRSRDLTQRLMEASKTQQQPANGSYPLSKVRWETCQTRQPRFSAPVCSGRAFQQQGEGPQQGEEPQSTDTQRYASTSTLTCSNSLRLCVCGGGGGPWSVSSQEKSAKVETKTSERHQRQNTDQSQGPS